MNKVKYRVTLDLTRPGVQHTIYAKKDDALSREVVFALRTKGEAYKISSGTSAYLYALADGAEIFSDCKISDSTIIAPLTTNILAAKDILLEVRLTDGTGAVLTTPQVKVISETSLYSEDAITATNDYSALLSAINRAENARITNISADGNVITITYVDGQTVSVEVEIEDGFSPVVAVEAIDGGHKVSITDKTHTETFNVMDGKDGVGGNGGGGAPADWNASEGEAGHVLNRTHYEEPETILVEKANFTPDYVDNDGVFEFAVSGLTPPLSDYNRKEFVVSWNGVEYKCSAFYLVEGEGGLLLGNYGAILGTGVTEEPFIVMVQEYEGIVAGGAYALDGSTEVEFEWRMAGAIKELDKKFIRTAVNELTGEYAFSFTATEDNAETSGDSGSAYMISAINIQDIVGKTCHFNIPLNGERYDFYPVFSSAEVSEGSVWLETELPLGTVAKNGKKCVTFGLQPGNGAVLVRWSAFDYEEAFVPLYGDSQSLSGKILGFDENVKVVPIDPPKTGIDKNSITLGVHTDGLVYVFVDGTPCGTGISMTAGGSTDVVGNVDENNNIVITGYLPDGEYTLKYAYADGTTSEVGNFVVGNPTPSPSYKNLANPSDVAWYTNKRLNSSGVLTDVTDAQRGTDTVVMTNLFDISSATTIHVKDLDIMNKTAGGQNYGRVYLYDDTGAYVHYNQPSASSTVAFSTADYDANVTLIDVNALKSGHAYKLGEGRSFNYFALGGILTGTADDVTITADQQIK